MLQAVRLALGAEVVKARGQGSGDRSGLQIIVSRPLQARSEPRSGAGANPATLRECTAAWSTFYLPLVDSHSSVQKHGFRPSCVYRDSAALSFLNHAVDGVLLPHEVPIWAGPAMSLLWNCGTGQARNQAGFQNIRKNVCPNT